MTAALIAIALKSVIVAATALLLLALMKRRSAAERSWIAHIGLLALLLLAFAPLLLPAWRIEAPALLGPVSAAQSASKVIAPSMAEPARSVPIEASPIATIPAKPRISAAAAVTAFYAVPAAILLLITFLALLRLVSLRARADVLVDGHWLSALARAQRRMGFKHGTALLTSDELGSPISWGLLRPVILLNSQAVEAPGEAEAIIAHELAHVARLDWAKLLLARIATALFWFNPLVWALAREAHQLREEAADDAVLGADISDTDYAQLLVGIARHECSGLLLGAHGVAPSKSSLARRVARVLDNASMRGPAPRPFAFGVFTGALLVATPLAALTLTPKSSTVPSGMIAYAPGITPAKAYHPEVSAPADLPHIIAAGVSTAVAVVSPPVRLAQSSQLAAIGKDSDAALTAAERDAAQRVRDAAQRVRDAAERERDLAEAARDRAREMRHVGDTDHTSDDLVTMKWVGITPEYVEAMRAAAPRLRALDPSDFVAMKAVGVTPDYARDLTDSGLSSLSADALTEARATGLKGSYIRAMIAAGVRGSFEQFMELWTTGVRPEFIKRARRAGYTTNNPEKLMELQSLGIDFNHYRVPPLPPRPPAPPGRDRSSNDDPDGG